MLAGLPSDSFLSSQRGPLLGFHIQGPKVGNARCWQGCEASRFFVVGLLRRSRFRLPKAEKVRCWQGCQATRFCRWSLVPCGGPSSGLQKLRKRDVGRVAKRSVFVTTSRSPCGGPASGFQKLRKSNVGRVARRLVFVLELGSLRRSQFWASKAEKARC